MTGSLAPPPPYGSEQGSILLEAGGNDLQQVSQQQTYSGSRHGRSRSRFGPIIGGPTSPGPVRSPTDISLSQLVHIPSQEDFGEGTSRLYLQEQQGLGIENSNQQYPIQTQDLNIPPPKYTSPEQSTHSSSEDDNTSDENTIRQLSPRPPAPSYDIAIGSTHSNNVESEISEAVRDCHSSHQTWYPEKRYGLLFFVSWGFLIFFHICCTRDFRQSSNVLSCIQAEQRSYVHSFAYSHFSPPIRRAFGGSPHFGHNSVDLMTMYEWWSYI